MTDKTRTEQQHSCADWSDAESISGALSDKQESDVLYWHATSEPAVVGALIMGIKGDRWPRRRYEGFLTPTMAAAIMYHACIFHPSKYGE